MEEFKLLVSAKYVKKFTGINEAIDESLLAPAIYTAQISDIEPILGEDLYNDMFAENINGAKKILLDKHVRPTLCWYGVHNAIPAITKRVGAGGVYKSSPTNAESGSDYDNSFLRKHALIVAEKLAKKMLTFAMDNELIENNCKNDDVYPFFGIHI